MGAPAVPRATNPPLTESARFASKRTVTPGSIVSVAPFITCTLLYVGAKTVLIALTRNDYLPDICFFRAEKAQNFLPEQVKYPAPDFIVEVLSPGTAAIDRGIKFEEYAANGVQEYWIVDPGQQTVEQYVLHNEEYELLLKVKSGEISSEVVKGFTIPIAAIFDRKRKNQVLIELLSAE